MDDNEFPDVTAALQRYRPAAPSPDRAARIAATLAPKSSLVRRLWPLAAAAGVMIGLGAWRMGQKTTPAPPPLYVSKLTDSQIAEFKRGWFQQTRVSLPYKTQQGGVTIVVFLDWRCPGCLVFEGDLRTVWEPLQRKYPGRIAVFYEDWPWESVCNSALTPGQPPNHPGSCELASAVRQARARGRDQELIEWIKKHNYESGKIELPGEFKVTGVDPAVQESVERGKRLKITSTPTVFINGVRVDQLMSADYLDLAIRLELERTNGSGH